MTPDVCNACFEFCGALFITRSVRRLLRERAVAGVSPVAVGFFAAWGYWNLYFYPHVGALWSYRAGIAVTAVNTVWVALLLYYDRRQS